MISEELLSKVLESQVDFICDGFVNKNESFIRFYLKFSNQILEINIYELAHKCKEWAWGNTRSFHKKNHGDICAISSGVTYQNKFYCEIGYGSGEDETFEGGSEPEAIFKACQWILDNKEETK